MVNTSPSAGRRGLWGRWLGLLEETEPGTGLALFRIACGLTVLGTLGTVVCHGLAPVIWLDAKDGGYGTLGEPPWLFHLLGGVTPVTLWAMIGVAAAAGLALTLGLAGRPSALVLLQSYLAISGINSDISGIDDVLIGNALWLLVLARSTATLSLACRLRTGSWTSGQRVPAWPRYLAIYQLVLVYCTTGLQKISIHWTPFGGYSALYYILQEPSWQRWDMSWLAWVYPLTQVATAVTWFWEVTAPLLLLALWYRRTPDRPGRIRACFNRVNFRRWFVILGVLMHLSVWLFIGLGPFSWITLSFYCCLYHPAEWRRTAWSAERGAQSAEPGTRNGSLRAPRSALRTLTLAVATFHVLTITLMAIPGVPDGYLSRADWQLPVPQVEFAAWADFLNGLGFDLTPKELEDRLWKAATGYAHVRKKVLAPFQWYYQYCGTRQSWRMFSAPNLEPTRLYIDVREAGGWRAVFVEGARDHAWLGRQLNHEHMRTALYTLVMFDTDNKDKLRELAQWAAVRAVRDFPQAERLRLRVHHYPTPTPQEVRQDRRPPGTFRIVADLRLAKHRQ